MKKKIETKEMRMDGAFSMVLDDSAGPAASAPSSPQKSNGRLAFIYLATSFLVAWVFWMLSWLYTKNLLPHVPLAPTIILGSFGPFVAAGLCTWIEGGLKGMLRFYARAFKVRMGWPVFMLSFCLPPLLTIAAVALHARLIHTDVVFQMTWADLPVTYLWLFLLGGTLGEEFGWSYLSDKLDVFFPLPQSTFVLGTIWACWHLPLFAITAPGLSQPYTPFYMFFLMVVSMRFLFAWSYHKSNYNVLSNMVFHNAFNLSFNVVAIAPTASEPGRQQLWYFVIFTIISATLLWFLFPLQPKKPPEA
ncbi:MAG: hypothetical protein WBP70_13305, partial [Terriglobales bacterium]